MKGAVQGEAITTASTPERKSLASGCLACALQTDDGAARPNSNTPTRLSPISVKSPASTATTPGDCNWKPQPSCAPAARSASIAPPSARNDSITPPVYARPALRCALALPACRAKPSTLIARIGNTQGIRFSSRPPSRAPSKAMAKVPAGWAGRSVVDADAAALAALAVSAACSAGDTSARAGVAAAGQVPATGASVRHAIGWPGWRSASASATTTGSTVGLALRWSASGIVAVQVLPCQLWVQSLPETAAVRITSGVSGKNASVLPCTAAGRPSSFTCRLLPLTSMPPGLASGWGCAACAASNSALCSAVEPCSGSERVNSPSSGMHSLRQTSQEALSFTSIAGVPPASAIGGL